MELVNLILNIAIILLILLAGLFTKHYLPSYMEKKGENLVLFLNHRIFLIHRFICD